MNLTTNHPAKPGETSRSRSDELRQRRSQGSARRVNAAVSRAVAPDEPRPARPVLVRNTTFGTPVRSRVATTNPRRQYYVALDTPGAELRLPALPRLHLGPRLASGILALACLVGIFSMLFSSLFIIGTPVVAGLQRLTQADIEAVLDIANFNAVEVNSAELSARLLKQFDILESARVTVSLPNKVSVKVTERTPVVAWQADKDTRWIDDKGFLFTPAGEQPAVLTILSADQPPYYTSPAELQSLQDAEAALNKVKDEGGDAKQYQAALAALELARKPEGPRQIDPLFFAAARKLSTELPEGTALAYSQANGLGWVDAGGWEVYVGTDLTRFDQKMLLYQNLIEQLNGQGITPAVISVEYLNAPYYRLER